MSWLDWRGFDYLDYFGDFSAGFGDTITSGFGLTYLFGVRSFTEWVRSLTGANNAVDPCSIAYKIGKWGAYAWGVSYSFAVSARVAGYETYVYRYPKARGAGMTIVKRGEKFFGAEWHRFKIGSGMRGVPGKLVNRPHIDIPPLGIKHWPW